MSRSIWRSLSAVKASGYESACLTTYSGVRRVSSSRRYCSESVAIGAWSVASTEGAESAASHFWFLGARPHPYDKWKARNEVAFRAMRDGVKDEVRPEPTPEEVPYPSDPLRRLVALHASSQEVMTGLVYASPWPSHDARFR